MKPNKNQLKKEALKQIKILFKEAKIQFSKRPELANRYVKLARKTSMAVNLSIPSYLKRKFCKHCYTYLVPGKNSRVRIHRNKVIQSCFACKKFMRFQIKRKHEVSN